MKKIKYLSAMAIGISIILPSASEAFSRITYNGSENIVITGRSWDWSNDGHADLWAYPAGIPRSGSGDNAVFEYTNDKLVIHHGKQYNVMTNDEIYAGEVSKYFAEAQPFTSSQVPFNK